MQQTSQPEHVRYNMGLNVADAGFFGFGMQISSFTAMIPLFANTLTESTLLIGLIANAHMIGWQLPQLFTAGMVARRKRYLPLVLLMTIHERWPYFLMAVAALALGSGLLSKNAAFLVLFIAVWIHSLGGGLTATAWQSMISKIMPAGMRGTFYGVQSSVANLLGAGGAVIAGLLLTSLAYPYNFAACFFITGALMMVSFGFLAATREPEHEPEIKPKRDRWAFLQRLREIMTEDSNFRWFVIARALFSIATMSTGFYALYAVREHGMSTAVAGGLMVGVLTISQTIASPIAGRIGDKYGHRLVFVTLVILMILSAMIALVAPNVNWFFLVFALTGMVNAQWTTILAIAPEFSPTLAERPLYIGLMNTAISPITLFAPLIGGALADIAGFEATFRLSIGAGILAVLVLVMIVRDPRSARVEDRLIVVAGD